MEIKFFWRFRDVIELFIIVCIFKKESLLSFNEKYRNTTIHCYLKKDTYILATIPNLKKQ
jgi:hypothetical protein